jgi:hypothetical protein
MYFSESFPSVCQKQRKPSSERRTFSECCFWNAPFQSANLYIILCPLYLAAHYYERWMRSAQKTHAHKFLLFRKMRKGDAEVTSGECRTEFIRRRPTLRRAESVWGFSRQRARPSSLASSARLYCLCRWCRSAFSKTFYFTIRAHT